MLSKLSQAILSKDTVLLNDILSNNIQGLDLNTKLNYIGGVYTPLELAHEISNKDAFKALAEAGAKPTLYSLKKAMLNCDNELLDVILKHGQSLDLNTKLNYIGNVYTPLELAHEISNKDAFKALAEAGAKPTLYSLKKAMLNCDNELLDVILKHGQSLDLNTKLNYNYSSYTPLELAQEINNTEILKLLINHGVKPDIAILQKAILSDNAGLISVIYNNTSNNDLNTKHEFKYNEAGISKVFKGTALDFAFSSGKAEVFKVLAGLTFPEADTEKLSEINTIISKIGETKANHSTKVQYFKETYEKIQSLNNKIGECKTNPNCNHKPLVKEVAKLRIEGNKELQKCGFKIDEWTNDNIKDIEKFSSTEVHVSKQDIISSVYGIYNVNSDQYESSSVMEHFKNDYCELYECNEQILSFLSV
ncbi:hypothetical protein NF27_CG01650 [Candidatus Jidaibacter acanthamoeba]|uniref:Uncharacterized protein n=1 Tax=Candidatus Jidaibacter acanthamoebae TaxID=86105 RepID=A0A0C1R126_9RICK|nr:hypothetical protein [Candidatus Jidaibacter acanthamoeba]KIE05985.1 hypothetical protein NF27_CG01650 [Candidatus Jidaibacter acanthamoeba]